MSPGGQGEVDPSSKVRSALGPSTSSSREETKGYRIPASGRKAHVEPFPDFGSLSDADLKQLIDELTKEGLEDSYRRRILQGRIDLLRAELQARLQKTGGKSVLEDEDVER